MSLRVIHDLELVSYFAVPIINSVSKVSSALKRFFRERDALGIFHQIIAAVTYLHERDIAHRNLNIHNILYNRQTFQIKISNFLCAVQTTSHSATSKGII